jgi:hypothetical protein
MMDVLTHSFQFVEEQAIDRVHRLNQTVDVKVYKLTVKDTVEERILNLQDRKRQLANAAIEGKVSAGKLTMRDMMALFGREAEIRFDQGSLDLSQKTRLLVSVDDDKDGSHSGSQGASFSGSNAGDSLSSQSLPPSQLSSRDLNRREKSSATEQGQAKASSRIDDPAYGRRW